jgi:hypothetical protein
MCQIYFVFLGKVSTKIGFKRKRELEAVAESVLGISGLAGPFAG